MKKILLLLLSLLLGIFSFAQQEFTDDTEHDIPEDTAYHCFRMNVQDVGMINDHYGLKKVCVYIESDVDSELVFYLQSPDGTQVLLSAYNGGDGDDYGSGGGWGSPNYTCFTMTASDSITAGTAPFEGEFIPEGDLARFNNFQNADGYWYLCVADIKDNGSNVTLNEWTLTFDTDPPHHINRITHDCSNHDDYFYDLGGSSNDYSPGEWQFWVICPSDSTQDIGLDFEEWDVEDSVMDDHLKIWDDSVATGIPFIDAGDVTGASLDGILARANNSSGCLTLLWQSDGDTLIGTGWKAKMECYTSCQKVQFAWDGSNPSDDTNYIAVCQGEEITFKNACVIIITVLRL